METLAINGGAPVYNGCFPRWPQWGAKEEANLMKVAESKSWGTLGNFALSFAKRFAEFVGVPHAIAVNSGTRALELILRGAAIGRGDEVIVSPYTFSATVSAIAYIGAMPVFADVDERTGNIDAESVAKHITAKTKAVMAVHIGGYPCDMDALKAVTSEHGLLLIEDCAHAHGSAWRNQMCGGIGDAAGFSFQNSKVLPAGEGGMITTGNEDLFERCWRFHHSGRAFGGREGLTGKTLMGTNARMAEWQAAVLDAQLDRLPEQCAHRQKSIRAIMSGLADLPGIILPPEDPRVTALSGFLFQFQWKGSKASRDEFVQALRAEGIPCSAGYVPLHRMNLLQDPAFEKATGKKFEQNEVLAAADELSKTAVWFTNNVLLAEAEIIDKVVQAVKKVATQL
ncbi:MAG TPA: DegT/DnrJ/EryC1/StrS family aminotransferase [Lentisphaeria bacterium]|nr:MAG: L-glutamine:2-deoxy-scyllo-inosose aminotransferase [Lentisphaerae bacterium ADurb.Bin082]HQC51995.1 DegT/DnrJ/EryC1/StrS family aminotransferase [Lentisphaeria bacterium]HQL86009.1 DegT/DnrJ/EryC1/StrS family aminotransferase [Lentisphaeria bacterium]